jgi:CMP-N-acetylneuraminic acid synthetase
MYAQKKILCIIPARGGSKRLPGKNLKLLLGVPLISYGIRAAKDSKYVDRVIVSTDDQQIAEVAKEQGAEVPFMRPAELATDSAPVIPALQHAVAELEKLGEKFDFIVLVQPTVPGVLAEDIDAVIEKIEEVGTNSAITVCEIVDRPEWMYRRKEDTKLIPYAPAQTTLSQEMEELYRVNGAVYVVKREVLMQENKLIDKSDCASVLMPRERSTDIDTQADFDLAEFLLTKNK